MSPTVTVSGQSSKAVVVTCPICNDGAKIPRTAGAWIEHFERVHGAEPGTWAYHGMEATERGWKEQLSLLNEANLCYGCNDNFATSSELTTHLDNVHLMWGLVQEDGDSAFSMENSVSDTLRRG